MMMRANKFLLSLFPRGRIGRDVKNESDDCAFNRLFNAQLRFHGRGSSMHVYQPIVLCAGWNVVWIKADTVILHNKLDSSSSGFCLNVNFLCAGML